MATKPTRFEFQTDPMSIIVKGVARYPWLNTPDTKFDPIGAYRVDLIVTEAEGRKLKDEIMESVATPAVEEAQAYFPKITPKSKARKVRAQDVTIGPLTDEEGNETGDWMIRLKMKAGYLKDGAVIPKTLPLVDSQLKPVQRIVGSGSELKCKITVKPYAFLGDSGFANVGASMHLQGVQVLRMVAPGQDASSMFTATDGFVEEEEAEDAGAGEGYDQ